MAIGLCVGIHLGVSLCLFLCIHVVGKAPCLCSLQSQSFVRGKLYIAYMCPLFCISKCIQICDCVSACASVCVWWSVCVYVCGVVWLCSLCVCLKHKRPTGAPPFHPPHTDTSFPRRD